MGRLAVPLALALLAACVPKLPGSGPEPTVYDLTPKSTFDASLPAVDFQLLIDTPSAPAALDSSRIVVRETATRLDHVKDAIWADRVPALVQTLLVESFENSDRIVAVGRQSVGLRADYALKVDVREFQLERFGASPEAHVHLVARLIRMPDRRIVDLLSARSSVPAGQTVDSVVHGFDEALGKVLKEIVGWALRTGAADYAGGPPARSGG